MHTDYFAVPNLTFPVRRGQRPPILRFVVFVMVVLGCVAADALVLFALYKGGAVLVAQYDPELLAQGIVGSAAALYLAYRVRRALRGRASDEDETGRDHGASVDRSRPARKSPTRSVGARVRLCLTSWERSPASRPAASSRRARGAGRGCPGSRSWSPGTGHRACTGSGPRR